jgi:Bifunctional DNA primase/polymerase, N-terminal
VTNDNLAAALRLAAARMHVFPCNPNPRPHPKSKNPLVKWTTQATTAAAGVRYFFTGRYAGAIPGVHLGKAGLVVLDLDVGHAEGQDGVSEFDSILDRHGGSLDGVPIVRTASGGYHLYFRQPMGHAPLGNREGMLAGRGINVRGDGGFVIGSGAVMADGTFYECVAGWPDLCEAFAEGAIPEIPAWLVELIESQPEQPDAPLRGPSAEGGPGKVDEARNTVPWAQKALRNISASLTGAPKGSRNSALNLAVCTCAGKAWCGLSEREVYDAMLWACTINKYIADDGIDAFNATFRSGWNFGIAHPLPGPPERYPDDPGIIIDLKEKEPAGS